MNERSKDTAAVHVEVLAKAEKILNRTLAYQAAIAVHELKDALGIDVEELKLVVAPNSDTPGAYRVVCTIATMAASDPVKLEVVVAPEQAVMARSA